MYTENVIFLCISWERQPLSFSPGKKYVFGGKIPSFQIIQKISCAGAALWEKYRISVYFFEKDHLSFISFIFSFIYFFQGIRSYFREKRNIIFLDTTSKIIFQRNFFGKIIFSGRLEKENTVFRAVVIIWFENIILVSSYFSSFYFKFNKVF